MRAIIFKWVPVQDDKNRSLPYDLLNDLINYLIAGGSGIGSRIPRDPAQDI